MARNAIRQGPNVVTRKESHKPRREVVFRDTEPKTHAEKSPEQKDG